MRMKTSVRFLAIVVVSGVLPFWGSLAAQEAHGHGGVSHVVPVMAPQPAAWQPAAPQGGTASGPRYIYGPGYYGYGYYYYPGPAMVPRPVQTTPSYLGTPWNYGRRGSTSGYTVGPGHRDWTAGRDLPLAKPWLRPMD